MEGFQKLCLVKEHKEKKKRKESWKEAGMLGNIPTLPIRRTDLQEINKWEASQVVAGNKNMKKEEKLKRLIIPQ